MAVLTLKNRFAGAPFVGRFDGQVYEVRDTLVVPDYVAVHLKRQSIVRDNPVTGDNEYRLAIVEHGDSAEPLTSLPLETLDRSDMEYPRAKVIPSNIRQSAPAPRDGTGSHGVSTKERG